MEQSKVQLHFLIMEQEYLDSIKQEDEMRVKMYQPEYENHLMNTDPHFNLTKLTDDWFELPSAGLDPNSNNLFNTRVLKKRPVTEIKKSLAELDFLLKVPGLFIAGGRVFSAIYKSPVKDVDIFLIATSGDQAKEKVWQLFDLLKIHHDTNDLKVTRTKNALTFLVKEIEYQLILRLYRTPSEVLHGFDVDSCCLGYDGQVWMTPRCQFALGKGYNTVNFDRLSPSYEWRLAKYATRGMQIKVPDFDRSRVKEGELHARFDQIRKENKEKRNMRERYSSIKGKNPLLGLDILLYMELHCASTNYHPKMVGAVEQLAQEASDYCPVPYTRYGRMGQMLDESLEYIIDTADGYPELATEYLPYFYGYEYNQHRILKGYKDKRLDQVFYLSTNLFMRARSIDFISEESNSHYSHQHIDLKLLCDLPERLYTGLGIIRPWSLPRQLEFKVTNPGEQMTGTFHKTVLEDLSKWYKRQFYA